MKYLVMVFLLAGCSQQDTALSVPVAVSAASQPASAVPLPVTHYHYKAQSQPRKSSCGPYSDFDYRAHRGLCS